LDLVVSTGITASDFITHFLLGKKYKAITPYSPILAIPSLSYILLPARTKKKERE